MRIIPVLRWVGGLVVARSAGLMVVTTFTRRDVSAWVSLAPVIVLAVLVVAETVERARRGAGRHPVRAVLGPGFQGLGDAQDIQLGRPTGLVPVYAPDEPQATELVVPHGNPLDEAWTVAHRADGTVDVEPADRA